MSDNIIDDFKSCTGITNEGLAIQHLEEANWDLLEAIERVVPRSSQRLPSEMASTSKVAVTISHDLRETDDMMGHIQFIIYNEATRNTFELTFSIKDTIRTLKIYIYQETGIEQCKQRIIGWGPINPPNDDTTFYAAGLRPAMKTLVLPKAEANDGPPQAYIFVTDQNVHREIMKKYPMSSTVTHIIEDMSKITGIPVTNQIWTGWIVDPRDYGLTLEEIKDDKVEYYLTVKRAVVDDDEHSALLDQSESLDSDTAEIDLDEVITKVTIISDDDEHSGDDDDGSNGKVKETKQKESGGKSDMPSTAPKGDSDSSMDDSNGDVAPPKAKKLRSPAHADSDDGTFTHSNYDADDDFRFGDDTILRQARLIPDDFFSEQEAVECFTSVFEIRYGHVHPPFFNGTLSSALDTALPRDASRRQLLALYLHDDRSVLTNVFCSEILCKPDVTSFFRDNILTWAWDVTSVSNRDHLVAAVTQHISDEAATMIRETDEDNYPLVVMVSRKRTQLGVQNILNGNTSHDEFAVSMRRANATFLVQLTIEITEDEENRARQSVVRQQDEAYRQSLEMDRAKEAEKAMEQQRAAEEEQKKRVSELKKKALIEESLLLLPQEPAEGAVGETRLRFRIPETGYVDRRFLVTDTLKVVFTFLATKGFIVGEYRLVTTFPRNELRESDSERTLEDLHLFPQVSLAVEKLEDD